MPQQPEYRRHEGEWTVYATRAQLLRAIAASEKAGLPHIVITVTKKDGTTKEQVITGKGWTDTVSRDRNLTTHFLRLPEGDRPGTPAAKPGRPRSTSGHCAECNRHSTYLEDAPDSSGIVLPVCPRCARLDDILRSYA